MCEEDDECILSQVGGFAAHVWSGDDMDPSGEGRCVFFLVMHRIYACHLAVIGDKRCRLIQKRLNHRMTSIGDAELVAVVHEWL